jgi:hypothetical protein
VALIHADSPSALMRCVALWLAPDNPLGEGVRLVQEGCPQLWAAYQNAKVRVSGGSCDVLRHVNGDPWHRPTRPTGLACPDRRPFVTWGGVVHVLVAAQCHQPPGPPVAPERSDNQGKPVGAYMLLLAYLEDVGQSP